MSCSNKETKAQSRDSNDKYNDGILVEDPGNSRDIVALTRNCFDDLSTDGFSKVESQICADLGVETLRDYVQNPVRMVSGFFILVNTQKANAKPPFTGNCRFPHLSTPYGFIIIVSMKILSTRFLVSMWFPKCNLKSVSLKCFSGNLVRNQHLPSQMRYLNRNSS